MIEQLIQDLITAVRENTAALKETSVRTYTMSSGTTEVLKTDATPAPATEPKKRGPKPKVESTPAPEAPPATITPEVVEPAPVITLPEIRKLAQTLVDKRGDANVIREYVGTLGIASLKDLPEDKFAAAHAFIKAEMAK